ILSSDAEITVIGTADNGVEAIDAVARHKPDVVTMDIIMPEMDGYAATRRIMETSPLPIVIVTSSLVKEEVDKTWRAVEAGAVAVLQKPGFFDRSGQGESGQKLIQTVKAMSQVKVVRRWAKTTPAPKVVHLPRTVVAPPPLPEAGPPPVPPLAPSRYEEVKIVAIGASTGGPTVLQSILCGLPGDFPVPVVVVQHISPGFTVGFVDWLNRSSSLTVHLARNDQVALPGNAYVAPDGHQMKVDPKCKIQLTGDAQENGTRPSVSYLFRSVAHAFGKRAVGILLTGMGKDGSAELKLMKDHGAVTIAQDKETSVVYGMPWEAVKLGGATYSLPPQKIIEMLQRMVTRGKA
ncbi:MAG: chemotaxis-specific protein-glutamate methyltransferase CheB, partial [Deltaproteobacteria bacterium]|nr:chemotaxis-specific protein-glutamate methyltransferase CheB [Deltaproteobacteria bacterium]